MSHVPRFWREKGFVGWAKFLKKLAEEQPEKVLNSVQLAQFYCPYGVEEQDKVQSNISNALSLLKTAGTLTSSKRGYYKYAYPFPPMPEKTVTSATAVGTESHPEIVVDHAPYAKIDVEMIELLRPDRKVEKLAKAIQFALESGVEIPLVWIEQYNNLIK